VLAGDSAGGGLTLAGMVSLRAAGDPLPACAWCISPWTDLRMTGASMAELADIDPLISKPYLDGVVPLYAGQHDVADPMISPLHADLRGLPPLLVQVGSAETLLDDSIRLVRVAAIAGVPVALEVYPDMIHVWHLFHQRVAAGQRALEQAGRFMRALCAAAPGH
jgi:acetyl esterase/lipase